LLLAWGCRHHRGRRLAIVPGARRAAADLELGQHDRGGARKPRRCAATCLPSCDRDVLDRALLQYCRRYDPRDHRSTPGLAVNDTALLSVEDVAVDLPTPRGKLAAFDRV